MERRNPEIQSVGRVVEVRARKPSQGVFPALTVLLGHPLPPVDLSDMGIPMSEPDEESAR